jgi:hypothetical protein
VHQGGQGGSASILSLVCHRGERELTVRTEYVPLLPKYFVRLQQMLWTKAVPPCDSSTAVVLWTGFPKPLHRVRYVPTVQYGKGDPQQISEPCPDWRPLRALPLSLYRSIVDLGSWMPCRGRGHQISTTLQQVRTCQHVRVGGSGSWTQTCSRVVWAPDRQCPSSHDRETVTQFPLDLETNFHKTTKLGTLEPIFVTLDPLEIQIR